MMTHFHSIWWIKLTVKSLPPANTAVLMRSVAFVCVSVSGVSLSTRPGFDFCMHRNFILVLNHIRFSPWLCPGPTQVLHQRSLRLPSQFKKSTSIVLYLVVVIVRYREVNLFNCVKIKTGNTQLLFIIEHASYYSSVNTRF